MSRARELLSSPRIFALALFASIALAIPAIGAGYFLDDYLYIQHLRDGGGSADTALGLYRLTAAHGGPAAAIRHGYWPWWFDTSAKVELCRPLSGLLFAFDQRLWPDAPWLAHLHSLGWYLLLVGAAWLLLRRLPPLVAGVALLAFVLDDGHWQGLGWIANRHSVIAAGPALLGVAAHVRWREGGHSAWALASMLGYAVGLAGGETAVQVLAYVPAFELFAARRRSLVAFAPVAATSLVYLALYKSLGYGARNHEQYLDPVGEPGRFLHGAMSRLPTLLADLFGGFPADLWAPLPMLRTAFVIVGVSATIAVGALAKLSWSRMDPEERRWLSFLAAGAIGALIPGAAGLPGSRLVMVSSLGGAAIVASIVVHVGAAVRDRAWPVRALGRAGAAWLVLIHLVVAPLALVFNLVNMRTIGRATTRMTAEAEIEPAGRAASEIDVAVLEAPDLVAMLYPPLVASLDPATRYRSWWTLSVAPHDHVFRRTGERSFTLSVREGTFFTGEWEKLFRSASRPLRPGDVVDLAGLHVRVLSPSTIAFEADHALDDPSLRLLVWKDGRFQRLRPPSTGEDVVIVRERGLLGL